MRKGRDLERSAIISTPPRARTAPALKAAGAGVMNAEARGRREQRAMVFMVGGCGGSVRCGGVDWTGWV